MKLIADCGSTKIQWCAVEDGKVVNGSSAGQARR